MNRMYIDGFEMYSTPESIASKQICNDHFNGRSLLTHYDGDISEKLLFSDNRISINGEGSWDYQALPLDSDIFLVTVHMLSKETPQYNVYVVDETEYLVTRIECLIVSIEKGSTPLSDTNNLVKRKIDFGYIGERKIVSRHHFTHDLCDQILETTGSPGNVTRYYIHSDTKISYYQKDWPLNGNPVDKDGVGYGEASYLKIRDEVYLITFTKHSHGNQPLMLWDRNSSRFVANFAGESRRNEKLFVMTGSGFLKQIHL